MQNKLTKNLTLGNVETEALMELALREAAEALLHDDVPVGAVIIKDSAVIASQHNRREVDKDPTAHAEVLALREAAGKLKTWNLSGCMMVVTLEPCLMCAGALALSRVDTLVFGAYDQKFGACGTLYNITCDPRINHRINVASGILEEKCSSVLSDFFNIVRSKNNLRP